MRVRKSVQKASLMAGIIVLIMGLIPITAFTNIGTVYADNPCPSGQTAAADGTCQPDPVLPPTQAPTEPLPAATDVAPTQAPTEPLPAATDVAPTQAPTEPLPAATDVAPTQAPAEPQAAAPVSTETPSVTDNSTLIADTVTALQEAGAVLSDASGNPIPLASQEAADILAAPDPIGCPSGVTPTWMGGTGVGCTAEYASIQDALDDSHVIDNAGWTIFIQQGTYNENVQVHKSVKFTGIGTGATATSISLFKDIDDTSSWFSSPLVIVNPGASIADALNLVAPGGTVRTSVYIYQGTTDSHSNLNAMVRDNSNNASPTYQLGCGEPNVYINLGATYNMILMDPSNPLIVSYYDPNGTTELHDLCIAANVAQAQGWSSVTAANLYEQREVFWKVLDKDDAGHLFDSTFQTLVTDIQNGNYDSVQKRVGIFFLVPTAGNDGITPAPASVQLTFINTCDDGNPTTTNILNADGTCSYQTKTCNDGYATTTDSLNTNGTCSFSCINGASNPPTCTTCTSGNVIVNGHCVPVVLGCKDHAANNFNASANVADNSLCTYDIVGCKDRAATNFNANANVADNSLCTYDIVGCKDRAATNFNANANVADNTLCTYSPSTPPLTPIVPLLIPVTGNCLPDIITAGIGHTCAVTPQTGLRCWGENDSGQLGDGKTANSLVPKKVLGLDGGDVIQLVSGTKHTCALTNGGEVMCWGLNFSGQLGNGKNINSNIPVKVVGLNGTITSISAGENFTCATNTDNITMCWGNNSAGQFKNGNSDNSNTPVVAGLGSNVSMVSGGQNELQGVLTGGALQFWSNLPAIPVTGLSNNLALVSADRFTDGGCAMTSDGKVNCWGAIQGTNISGAQDPNPLLIAHKECHKEPLVTGNGHGCTITDKGLVCWGTNDSGQLGDGTQTGSQQPVEVAGIHSVIDLAAGFKHTCAVVSQEEIKCWGQNTYGQLGNGSTKDSSLPVLVIK